MTDATPANNIRATALVTFGLATAFAVVGFTYDETLFGTRTRVYGDVHGTVDVKTPIWLKGVKRVDKHDSAYVDSNGVTHVIGRGHTKEIDGIRVSANTRTLTLTGIDPNNSVSLVDLHAMGHTHIKWVSGSVNCHFESAADFMKFPCTRATIQTGIVGYNREPNGILSGLIFK